MKNELGPRGSRCEHLLGGQDVPGIVVLFSGFRGERNSFELGELGVLVGTVGPVLRRCWEPGGGGGLECLGLRWSGQSQGGRRFVPQRFRLTGLVGDGRLQTRLQGPLDGLDA